MIVFVERKKASVQVGKVSSCFIPITSYGFVCCCVVGFRVGNRDAAAESLRARTEFSGVLQ